MPARGGSRGVPGKNIRPLGGRPLLAWGLASIAASGVVDRVVVSTDDEAIAACAREHGAEAPFLRPAELAGDATPTVPVVEHALAWLAEHDGFAPACVLLVQPTEPFVRPEQIREAYELLLDRDADSVISVVEVPRTFHPYHVRVLRPDGTLEFEHPDLHAAHPTRQSDPPRYAFGNLYWVRREAFLRERRLEAGRRVGLPVDPISALDINTPEDFALAEAIIHAADHPAR